MDNTIVILTGLVALAVGSGTGGIVGGVMMIRRFKLEQLAAEEAARAAEAQEHIGLREVDVEHFKAMFPGGLGDAVEHWRDEAKKLMGEVHSLRQIEQINYEEILVLRTEHDRTKSELGRTKRALERTNEKLELAKEDLVQANRRIEQLESERGTSHE